jgi:thiamine biosynthesis lipoprotein
MTLHELAFPAMGTEVRLLASPGAPLAAAREELERLASHLTRFDSGSELARLNRDPRAAVPASAVLRAAVRAALAGARLTGGLADPTLLDALERAGYLRSLSGRPRADLREALLRAPVRRPARPRSGAAWPLVAVEDRRGLVLRPPGVRLDLGGSAKGLIADRLVALLSAAGPCIVDCGGDVSAAGRHDVDVLHPLTGEPVARLPVDDSAAATSGIGARLWWDADGRPAHHLLDPATGTPAWTGVLAATALAPAAAMAEALAKAAVLAGPAGAATLLRRYGGVVVTDDGAVRTVGAAARPRTRVPAASLRREAPAPATPGRTALGRAA